MLSQLMGDGERDPVRNARACPAAGPVRPAVTRQQGDQEEEEGRPGHPAERPVAPPSVTNGWPGPPQIESGWAPGPQWRNQFVAVKLRLVRMGKKKQPTYRVVAADSRSPRDGRFLEILGTYAPRGASTAEPDAVIQIDNAKAVKWLVNGAQPTERVERLLKTSGAWDEFAAARAK